jgi:DNA repair and recombination protein RAD54B
LQVEAAQHAKLAALKQWRHMDPFNADSIRKVADHLLYNLARDDYKTYEMNGDKKATSTSTSTWDTTDVEPAAKKRKVGIMDVINTAREEASQASVPDSEAEDGGDSDEEDFVPSHRKRKSVRLKAVAKTGAKTKIFIATEKEDKKYNLRTMADGGQGGRITYVFERVSKSGYEQK